VSRQLAVDVRVGALLAWLVPRPRHVEQVVREQDAHGAPGPLGDRLTLAGVGSTEPARSGGTGFAGTGAGIRT
jgi:hypothetical protein